MSKVCAPPSSPAPVGDGAADSPVASPRPELELDAFSFLSFRLSTPHEPNGRSDAARSAVSRIGMVLRDISAPLCLKRPAEWHMAAGKARSGGHFRKT